MENYITYLCVVLTIGVAANLIMQYIDLRLKGFMCDSLDYQNEAQNILISEGQARGIAKIVKELMEQDGK